MRLWALSSFHGRVGMVQGIAAWTFHGVLMSSIAKLASVLLVRLYLKMGGG
jgi:hypothetical protein